MSRDRSARSVVLACLWAAACTSSSGAPADGGPDAGPSCPSPLVDDRLRSARERCAYAAGALARDTLGLSEPERAALPIRHVVVIMKENRSFDHLFGGLRNLQPAAEVFSAGFTNPDAAGQAVAPFHLPTTCVLADPGRA